MNLILLGAPGAGKGTQAELLTKALSIPAISTGNMLREAIANETPLGKEVKQYMDGGMLVPDELILSIIAQRVQMPDCENGFILDGVPRTLVQAEVLDAKGVRIDHVVSLEVDDAKIADRMSGRRVCKNCKQNYNVKFMPPKVEGVCDKCGGELFTREDDKLESITHRLEVYRKETEPLIDF